MSISEKPSSVALEDFLGKAMGSQIEAGFAEFLSLWQSSESLRLLIRKFVEKIPTASGESGLAEPDSESQMKRAGEGILLDWRVTSGTEVEKRLTQSYGGLTRKELLLLLQKYKAGNRDLGVYLLVRAWKTHMAGPSEWSNFRLKQLTLEYLGQSIAENQTDFFQKIADTLQFLKNEEFRENGQWNHDPGQWWQFHLLLYVLEHPKVKYPIREFVRHFETEVGANAMPTTKTLRSFCRSVGIALDSTPGAPKK